MSEKWMAVAYDSAHGFALGDTPETAQAAYAAGVAEPAYGFSIIRNRADYARELERVGVAMGYVKEKSMPMFRAHDWIVVARVTTDALAYIEENGSVDKLRNDWSRDDGEFFICTPPHRRQGETRQERRARASQLETINGMQPSDRQREWALRSSWNWCAEMDWANRQVEINEQLVANGNPPKNDQIELTEQEIAYMHAVLTAK